MVNCSNCGSGIADDLEFCGQCGAPRPTTEEITNQEQIVEIPEEPVPVPEPTEAETVVESEPLETQAEAYTPPPVYQQPPDTKKSSNTCLWIVLGCLVIFLILVCVVIVVLAVTMAAFTDTINQMFQTFNLGLYI